MTDTRSEQPLIDNVDDMRSHDVRRLTKCAHCSGVGDRAQMVWGNKGHDAGLQFHTQCYLRRYGFESVLKLPLTEQGKYRVCDLSVKQMRKLLALVPKTAGWDDNP